MNDWQKKTAAAALWSACFDRGHSAGLSYQLRKLSPVATLCARPCCWPYTLSSQPGFLYAGVIVMLPWPLSFQRMWVLRFVYILPIKFSDD